MDTVTEMGTNTVMDAFLDDTHTVTDYVTDTVMYSVTDTVTVTDTDTVTATNTDTDTVTNSVSDKISKTNKFARFQVEHAVKIPHV
jgi:carbohydrate-binding DOMON domain-containing protein